MADLSQIQVLAGKMEWFLLAINSHSDRSIQSIMMTHSAASVCVALATMVMAWILVDRSVSYSLKSTGTPRLGIAGHSGMIFFFLMLAPASDPAAWAALFGSYEPQLAKFVVDAAIPSIPASSSYLTEEMRRSFEVSASTMVTGMAAQQASYNFMSLIAGVFALHSVLVKGNEYVRRKSPFWLFAGGSLIFYAVACLTRPELMLALYGHPEAYLLKYLGLT